jgi:hypothetical protein
MALLDGSCARGPGIRTALNSLADLSVDTICCRIGLDANAEIERVIGRMRDRMHDGANTGAT